MDRREYCGSQSPRTKRGGGGEEERIRGQLVECVYTRTYHVVQKEIPGLASFASVAAFGRARLIVN